MSLKDDFLNTIPTRYEASSALFRQIIEHAPYLFPLLSSMVEAYGHPMLSRSEERIAEIRVISGHLPDPDANAVRAFVDFSKEFLTRQQSFLRTGKYTSSDFDTINAAVYSNEEYYGETYLPALLMCFILSANYYEFYDFFEEYFQPVLPKNACIAEFGCGHGLYLARCLNSLPEGRGQGFDISDQALKSARKLFSAYGIEDDRCVLKKADFRDPLPVESASLDAAICCEVLEHLPTPGAVLADIRRTLKPSGTALLSAAIRMESVDHLHLFKTPEEVTGMIRDAGLVIRRERIVPLTKPMEFDTVAEREALIGNPAMPLGYICIAQTGYTDE